MQFLSAASAWFAAALPIIALMYILKKTYRDTEVASHLLWRRVLQEQEANRPWQKLRGRWLLLLQLFAASLLVLALMNPVWTRPAGSDGHAVLVIDRSASMTALTAQNAVGGGGLVTRFQLAIEDAKQWVLSQPKSRPISVIATGPEPLELASRSVDHEAIASALDELTPFYGNADNTAALSLADSLHSGDEGGITVLFTDGLWRDAEEAGALLLHAPVELRAAGEEAAADNGSILNVGIRPDPADSSLNQAVVTVQNDSAQKREYTIELYAVNQGNESELAASVPLTVEPNEWGSADASGLPPAEYYKARLLPASDRILADNTAFGFPAIKNSSQVLLITEGNLFLEKALLLAGVQPVKISPDAAPPGNEQLKEIDWVVLDGSDERLRTDEAWTELLAQKPLWQIDHPAEGSPSSSVPKHSGVQTIEHPVTAYVTLQETHIGRFYVPDTEETSWGKPVLTYGGIPAIYAGSEGGLPRLRYTFKLQDTDLPLRPEFPVLIVQSAEWMSGGSLSQLGTVTAGEPVELPFQSETEAAVWEPVEWSGAGLTLEGQLPLPSVTVGADRQEAPAVPGLYKLVERDVKGKLLSERYLAVMPQSSELLTSGAGNAELKPQTAFPNSSEEGSAPSMDTPAPLTHQSLLVWAVLLVLAVMLAEWEVYRRGHTS
ncbi:VWA domain-containing protein [Paenibacillus nanensis]|uniref:VWA domain-containing protein n=1 Tax=Paenibacillus nanensis TaxID=393251 RepID=A0A3A1UX15_9BACL|nr:BatA and WFA domain-containing protein [Paenibacillus nanensis]RIX51732.1 VWA domain-containing protein [Paenibacillus nanensis]